MDTLDSLILESIGPILKKQVQKRKWDNVKYLLKLVGNSTMNRTKVYNILKYYISDSGTATVWSLLDQELLTRVFLGVVREVNYTLELKEGKWGEFRVNMVNNKLSNLKGALNPRLINKVLRKSKSVSTINYTLEQLKIDADEDLQAHLIVLSFKG